MQFGQRWRILATVSAVGGFLTLPLSASAQCIRTECEIDGGCISDGAVNPNNTCQVCDVDANKTAWTTLADFTACDDGDYCSIGESCRSGRCGGLSQRRTCSSLDVPSCALALCSSTMQSCVIQFPATTVATHCLIDSVCIPDGANDDMGNIPSPTPCGRYCDVDKDNRGWTYFPGECDGGVTDGGAGDGGTTGSGNNVVTPNTQDPAEIGAGGNGLFCAAGPQSHSSPAGLALWLLGITAWIRRRRRG